MADGRSQCNIGELGEILRDVAGSARLPCGLSPRKPEAAPKSSGQVSQAKQSLSRARTQQKKALRSPPPLDPYASNICKLQEVDVALASPTGDLAENDTETLVSRHMLFAVGGPVGNRSYPEALAHCEEQLRKSVSKQMSKEDALNRSIRSSGTAEYSAPRASADGVLPTKESAPAKPPGARANSRGFHAQAVGARDGSGLILSSRCLHTLAASASQTQAKDADSDTEIPDEDFLDTTYVKLSQRIHELPEEDTLEPTSQDVRAYRHAMTQKLIEMGSHGVMERDGCRKALPSPKFEKKTDAVSTVNHGVREYHTNCLRLNCYWADPATEQGLTPAQKGEHTEAARCLQPARRRPC